MDGFLLVATRDRHVVAVCEMVASLVGLDVKSEESGRTFFSTLRWGGGDATSIKIALVDDDLEDMRGYQLIPLIRDQHPRLKIIYVTQAPDPAVEVRVRQAGVLCVVDKPIEATLLEKLLRKTLEHETTRIWPAAAAPETLATRVSR